jgi:hypothetical protein
VASYTNRRSNLITYTSGSSSSYATPTITSASTVVGSSNGQVTMTVTTTKDFTKWPGKLELTLPTWYGTNGEYVLQSTSTCTSSELVGLSQSL